MTFRTGLRADACPARRLDGVGTTKLHAKRGALMPKYCVKCGQSNPTDANYCGGCGHKFLDTRAPDAKSRPKPRAARLAALRHVILKPNLQNLSAEGERRQVTVLRSDLSGYSTLFEALDPELVQELLEPIKEIAIEAIAARRGSGHPVQGRRDHCAVRGRRQRERCPRRGAGGARSARSGEGIQSPGRSQGRQGADDAHRYLHRARRHPTQQQS